MQKGEPESVANVMQQKEYVLLDVPESYFF